MATVSVGHQRQVMLLSTVCILAGLYLAVSPVLSNYKYSSGMTTVNVTLGMLIAAMSYFRGTIGGGSPWIGWVLIGLGVITLGSPWWMRYAFVDSFRVQHLIVGGIVVGLQFIGALMSHMVLAKQKS
jgi:hypothetical protein